MWDLRAARAAWTLSSMAGFVYHLGILFIPASAVTFLLVSYLCGIRCIQAEFFHAYVCVSVAVDVSTVEGDRIAAACGDNTIRVWNFANRSNPYDAVMLWRGLQSKITCVCIFVLLCCYVVSLSIVFIIYPLIESSRNT